jgi:hypothetical protein
MNFARLQWEADDTNRPELLKALQSGPVAAALQLLVLEGLPKGGRVAPDDIEANALLNARREGFYEFYHSLMGLTVAPVETTKEEPKPWGHIQKKPRRATT